ncbi:MAG: dTDP-4-dehydrorhamnose reductase [Oscillospiraceae bacterium]|nr:dTDP-4-dehydrorhamnose reductase [Oscillospiraceae bacterium]
MIIVTGAAGQLGTDVMLELKRRNIPHIGIDIDKLDITDGEAVSAYFGELCGSVDRKDPLRERVCVIHCAAYTAVDKAESESELCFAVNASGTENIARACRETDSEMIYISTDYVFDGDGDTPHETDAPKSPISVYGKSKLSGELAVLSHLSKYYIVRISWVFGEAGHNFVKTMLRLCETKDEIAVVCDQIGSPTYTADLSKLLCDMAFSQKYGEYHATNEGFCSWAEFAAEIMRQNKSLGGKAAKIVPITTDLYPTKAKRPQNSRLSKASLDNVGFSRLPMWQDALARFIKISH